MNIPPEQWAEASGGYVVDGQGRLWQIIGFIDRPAVILDPVRTRDGNDQRQRETIVMGAPVSDHYTRLVPQP